MRTLYRRHAWMSRAAHTLVLTITGPPKAKMVVEVTGLPESPSAIFGEVFDAWRAATGRTQKPFRVP